MPRQEYFSKAGLKSRGWTDGLIKKVLGNHDKEAPNTHHKSGPTVKLFARARVEQAEATESRVQKAVARNPERLAEHQKLVENRDRRFSWTLQANSFRLYLWYAGEKHIDISLRIDRQVASACVENEEFTLLARSAHQVGEGEPVIDWLLENEYGHPQFQDVLSRCMEGKAVLVIEEREARVVANHERRRERELRKKAAAFVREGRVDDFTVVARYRGSGRVNVEMVDGRGHRASTDSGNAECVRLARECDRNPLALLDWLADSMIGDEKVRAALACCRWKNEAGQKWWDGLFPPPGRQKMKRQEEEG